MIARTDGVTDRSCGACGERLTKPDPRARYCGNACRQQGHRNRHGSTRSPGSRRYALLRYLITAGEPGSIVALDTEAASWQLRTRPVNVAAALRRLVRRGYAKRDAHGHGLYSVRIESLPAGFAA